MKKLVLFLFLSVAVFAQVDDEWLLISSSGNSTTYMDTSDLPSFKGSDVYVWSMVKHNPAIVIESVDERIYKTKTYYLFNKELQRYSLLQIIYYDEEDNVLKSYSYNRNTEVTSYKYNFPVLRGSNEEVILQKIYEITGAPELE